MAFQTLNNIQRRQQGSAQQSVQLNFPALLEKSKLEIARALPKHLEADRMMRIALTAFRKTPALAKCHPMSVLAAVVQSSQLGLEIGMMGEAHLVPYKGECQLIPGYTGLMKLARQTGLVSDIYAHEVREKDTFVLKLGMERVLIHEPMPGVGGFPASEEERGRVVGFYAVAVFKDGSRSFEPMSVSQVCKIRDNSNGYKAAKAYDKLSPWDTDFEAMGLKTVIRRLCKFLPKSAELAKALALDAAAENGVPQNINLQQAADGTYEPEPYPETTLDPVQPPASAAAAPQSAAAPQQQPPKAEPSTSAPQQRTSAQSQGGAPARPAAVRPTAAAAAATDAPVKNEAQQKAASRVEFYLTKMRETQTEDDLNEVYIRGEAELSGADLEAISREYNVVIGRIRGIPSNGNGKKDLFST